MNLLITAGPTHEPIDSVRYIGNRSSGRMGIALAQAGLDAGHDVRLLLGPVGEMHAVSELRSSPKCDVQQFRSTADLQQLLIDHVRWFDVLIMAAAVADYRPVEQTEGKRPRAASGERWTLELEPTPDLVGEIARLRQTDQRVVAFALEEPAVLQHRAKEKLKNKGVDAIVANPLVTMESPDVQATLIWANGEEEPLPTQDKPSFARQLIERLQT